jgi:MSHA biogenesis protein MshE
MGAAGYMIAASVQGIVAQRLLRRVCEYCARPAPASEHETAWLAARRGKRSHAGELKVGTGCTYCNLSGYRGRVAVYEMLEIDRTLAEAIRRGDLRALDEAAHNRPDYVSLTQAAIELAMRGVTTLAEAIAVTSGLEAEEDLSGVTASWRSPFAPGSADTLLGDALTETGATAATGGKRP